MLYNLNFLGSFVPHRTSNRDEVIIIMLTLHTLHYNCISLYVVISSVRFVSDVSLDGMVC